MNSFYASRKVRFEIWPDFTAHFKSETTAGSYSADIDEIMNDFQKDFLEISKKEIENYFQKMQKQVAEGILKPSTVAKKFRELHSFAEFICENREKYKVDIKFEDGFYPYLKKVVKQEKYAKSIPAEHMDKLLGAAKKDPMAYTILTLLYRVGVSSSEIVSLKEQDLAAYDNGAYMTVQEREDVLYLPEDVFLVLEQYMREKSDSEYLFVNSRGNPLNLMYISRMMRKYTEKAGIPSYSAESVRNTCGINLFAYGAKPEQVAAQMGITEIQIHRYQNLSYKENLLKAANRLVQIHVEPPKRGK